MKYLIVSDSHGYNENLRKVIERVSPIEGMFHLGDLQCSLNVIEDIADCPVYAIAGNNDFRSELEETRTEVIGGKRIAMCHGHRHGAYYGISRLVYWGLEQEADVVMFGHTHEPFLSYEQGMALLNPGSISLPRQEGRNPTFTIMEIDKDGELHFCMNQL